MDSSAYEKSNGLTHLEVHGSHLLCTNCNHAVTNVRGVERQFTPWMQEVIRFEVILPSSPRLNPRWDPALMMPKITSAEADELFRPPTRPDPMAAYIKDEQKAAELDEQLRSLAAERVKPA